MLQRTMSICQHGMSYPYLTGAAGAKKSVQKNFEFLQGYEEIVLWFDNDEPGQEAAKAAAGVLPPGKGFHRPPRVLQGPLRCMAGQRS